MYLLKMFQLIVNANLNKLIMKGKREEAIVSKMKGSCLLVKKHALERLCHYVLVWKGHCRIPDRLQLRC